MRFQELRQQILRLAEMAASNPGMFSEPKKVQVWDLSQLWTAIAGRHFDDRIHLDGWKVDWVRAAKLAFLEDCCATAFPNAELDKSTDLPTEIYALVIEFVRESPAAVAAWIELHEEQILQRGNILMLNAFADQKQYVNRAPVLAAAHLPNVQTGTSHTGRMTAKEAERELFDF